MIHVCSVHWQDDRWIDLQLGYLKRFIAAPYRVYSIFTGIPAHHRAKFFYAREENIVLHEAKLNVLADIAWFGRESDDDWLIFLDGDAFPVTELTAYARDKLARFPLLAVRRDENSGDIQPHPSFCLTTLRFWHDLGGDWNRGFTWTTRDGRTRTDVGATLYRQLADGGHAWYPLPRSNRVDLHPLYFGIYDNAVYHHGAAFRRVFSTIDTEYLSPFWRFYDRRIFPLLSRQLAYALYFGRPPRARANGRVARKVMDRILLDPDFFRLFQGDMSRDALAQQLGVDPRDLVRSTGTAGAQGGA